MSSAKIADLVRFQRGVSWSSVQEHSEPGRGRIPVVRIPNIRDRLDARDLVYLSGVDDSTRSRAAVSKGWLLLVGSNGNPERIGNAVLVEDDTDYLFASFLVGIKPDPRKIDERFLLRILSSDEIKTLLRRTVRGSTGLQNINLPALANYEFELPRMSEQRLIAEILDTLDDQIRATQQIIAKLVFVQQGLIHDVMTRGIDADGELRPASSTVSHEIGPVPSGWSIRSLDSVVSHPITYGIVQAGPHVPGGIPYIRTGDMSGEDLSVDGMLRTSQRIASSFKRSTVRAGEIVCAIRATVGKVLPVPPELDGANLTQGTARIAPGPLVLPRFLLWEMRYGRFQHQISLSVKGTTFAEITLGGLQQLLVAVPDEIAEQRRVVAVLDQNDSRIRSESALLAKLQLTKRGVLADLLTGRVRVPLEAD